MERLTYRRDADGRVCPNLKEGKGWLTHMKKVADKLCEYEDAEEQGLLMRLPCKVGDTVWVIITSYVYGEIGDPPETRHHIEKRSFALPMFDEFGKTIFLTSEEAYASLVKEELHGV